MYTRFILLIFTFFISPVCAMNLIEAKVKTYNPIKKESACHSIFCHPNATIKDLKTRLQGHRIFIGPNDSMYVQYEGNTCQKVSDNNTISKALNDTYQNKRALYFKTSRSI